MRRRVLGTALTVVGVLMLLFAPVRVIQGCVYSYDVGSCNVDKGSSSVWGWVDYPAGWFRPLLWPMAFIGVAALVTGVVILLKQTVQALPSGRLGAANERRRDDSESKTGGTAGNQQDRSDPAMM